MIWFINFRKTVTISTGFLLACLREIWLGKESYSIAGVPTKGWTAASTVTETQENESKLWRLLPSSWVLWSYPNYFSAVEEDNHTSHSSLEPQMVGDKEYYSQAGWHGYDLIHQGSQDKRLTTLRSGLGTQQD